jgi:hypothetical protein
MLLTIALIGRQIMDNTISLFPYKIWCKILLLHITFCNTNLAKYFEYYTKTTWKYLLKIHNKNPNGMYNVLCASAPVKPI